MRIEYVRGNLVDAPEPIIAQGCNAQGKMGSGVAKAIRAKWPEVFKPYETHCKRCSEPLGTISFTATWDGEKMIANMITQRFYGQDGKQYVDYDAIRKAMAFLNKRAGMYSGPPHRVAMPKIGAGLGGGDWEIIEKIIEEESTDFQPVVYEL